MAKLIIQAGTADPEEFNIPYASARAIRTLLSRQSPALSEEFWKGYEKGIAEIQELLRRGYEPSLVQRLTKLQIQEILEVEE